MYATVLRGVCALQDEWGNNCTVLCDELEELALEVAALQPDNSIEVVQELAVVADMVRQRTSGSLCVLSPVCRAQGPSIAAQGCSNTLPWCCHTDSACPGVSGLNH